MSRECYFEKTTTACSEEGFRSVYGVDFFEALTTIPETTADLPKPVYSINQIGYNK
jgi:hypothetical protein